MTTSDDNAQLSSFIQKSLDGGETASESDVRVRSLTGVTEEG